MKKKRYDTKRKHELTQSQQQYDVENKIKVLYKEK